MPGLVLDVAVGTGRTQWPEFTGYCRFGLHPFAFCHRLLRGPYPTSGTSGDARCSFRVAKPTRRRW